MVSDDVSHPLQPLVLLAVAACHGVDGRGAQGEHAVLERSFQVADDALALRVAEVEVHERLQYGALDVTDLVHVMIILTL